MKNRLDLEMEKRNLQWFILTGPRHSNPDLTYFLGEVNILHPILIKKRGGDMIVIHNSLERGEVERLSFPGVDVEDVLPREETKRVKNPFQRDILFYDRLISRFGISGNCAIYGFDNIHKFHFLIREIQKKHPALKLVCDLDYPLFQSLRITKDGGEIDILRDVTARTMAVFEEIYSYISALRVHRGCLVDREGKEPLLGDLRRIVYTTMAANGLMATEIPIISMGRDAGIPHSTGDNRAPLEMGKTIVLDIFPRCISTSYLSDITRTVCIGKAPPRVREIYDHVAEAQHVARQAIVAGNPLSEADRLVSCYFEKKGYDTLQSRAGATSGYIHSLGHGVGLELHEKPRISIFNQEPESGHFAPGMVFTIEPGLYFPDEGIGVRIEDIAVLHEKDSLEILSPLAKTLEIMPEE